MSGSDLISLMFLTSVIHDKRTPSYEQRQSGEVASVLAYGTDGKHNTQSHTHDCRTLAEIYSQRRKLTLDPYAHLD